MGIWQDDSYSDDVCTPDTMHVAYIPLATPPPPLPPHVPSRHCRDARVYGHTTTAMHDNECTLPPPLHGIIYCCTRTHSVQQHLQELRASHHLFARRCTNELSRACATLSETPVHRFIGRILVLRDVSLVDRQSRTHVNTSHCSY